MEPSLVIDIGRQALIAVIIISGPLLVAGLIVGLAIGVFQAVTQIHEMTLTFIPKILAIVGMLFYLLPWMILKFINFSINIIGTIPGIIK
ncbi:MAG: flagellar biosynthesis protein FliQ [Chitinispirillia bacterium]